MRHCVRILFLAAMAGGASIALANNSGWRPASAVQLDIPHGDPLTAALTFSAGERSLFTDAADGRFDEHSLIDAALVACGDENPAAVERYRRQFAAVCQELRQEVVRSPDVESQIELIHRFLHQRLLHGGYDANATDLAGTFDTGIYNCASATLLFVALAEQLNLSAHAVELPGHVRAVIDFGDKSCEVEATCPAWSGAARWESSASHERQPQSFRNVSPLGLLAMIYYNRGVEAVYHSRYAEAVAANRKALLLDPNNATARGNLLAAVNNWSLALADAGRFDEAETLLASGRRYAPEHLPFQHNAAHVQRMRTHAAAQRASL